MSFQRIEPRLNGMIALLFLALTVIMTWPMAYAPGAAYSSRQDFYLGLWDLWWVAQVLTEEGAKLYWTTHLYYPFGTSLAVQPLTLLQTIAAAPLTLSVGPVVAYNLLVLFSFWFAGWITALWVRALTGNAVAGVVAGVIFAFSPFHYTYIPQLNVVAIGVLPLYLFANLSLHRRATPLRALGAGLALAVVALVSWYYAVGAGLVGIALSLDRILRTGGTPRTNKFRALWLETIHWGVCALLVAPVVLQMVSGFTTSEYVDSPTRPGISLVMTAFNGTGATLGLWTWAGSSALLLAGVGSWRQRKALPLLALAAGSMVLALGETMSIGNFELPMPYHLLEGLPVVRALRYPARFFIFSQLALAALAGMGAARIAAWGGRRLLEWRAPRFSGFAGVFFLMALPLAEFWPGPLPSAPLPERVAIPGIDMNLASRQPGAVFHLPTRFRNLDGELMFQQLGHGRPISGGYLTRPDPELIRRVRKDPYLGALLGLEPGALPTDLAAGLRRHGFAFVCVQKQPALPGYERLPFRALGPFSQSAGQFLNQRLFPAYEQQTEMHPDVAKGWISALEKHFGPPINDSPLAAIFQIPGG